MSTRGLIGFRLDGIDKLTYNHSDSYPEWLGQHLSNQLIELQATRSMTDLKNGVRGIRLVNEDDTPTEFDLARLNHLSETEVDGICLNKGSNNNFYNLLRSAQGDLIACLECRVMIDSSDFIYDSLFCEHAYIVNLDEETLEYYQGWQRQRHNKGRYSNEGPQDGYYPCALRQEIPIKELEILLDWQEIFKVAG